MNATRQSPRKPYTEKREIPVSIIQFGSLDRAETHVRAIDISGEGLGVESDFPLPPGFVWFRDRVGGHSGGVLVWTKKLEQENAYRAGIQLLSDLPCDEKEREQKSELSGMPPALQHPWIITSLLVDDVREFKDPKAGPHCDSFSLGSSDRKK